MLPVLHAGPAPWTWVSGVRVPDYSSGLALQAVGVRIRRSRSVALDGILGVAMTLYALLVSDFLGTVASLLQVMVALPRTAPTWRGTAGCTTRNGRSGRRKELADDLAAWREMLLVRFAGTPEDELLDRLVASPALAGPELNFLRARIAQAAVTSPRPPRSSPNA